MLVKVIILGTAASFWMFWGLTYGMTKPLAEMKHLNWLSSWPLAG
jgi:dolichyl-phosphate-mannose--protein O-mannosyl transferase